MPEDFDSERELDDGMGEKDTPDPGDPDGVTEVATDWEPPTDDETEADHA